MDRIDTPQTKGHMCVVIIPWINEAIRSWNIRTVQFLYPAEQNVLPWPPRSLMSGPDGKCAFPFYWINDAIADYNWNLTDMVKTGWFKRDSNRP